MVLWLGNAVTPGFRSFQISVPLGFRTNLGRAKDAKEDNEILVSGSGVVAQSDNTVPNAPCRNKHESRDTADWAGLSG